MSQIQVTDEWLFQNMPIVDRALIRELESRTDEEHSFSGDFEYRMEQLFRKERYIIVRKRLRKIAAGAAAVLACTFVAMFAAAMSVEAYRVRFFDTIRTVRDDIKMYQYMYSADYGESGETFELCVPAYIPAGYEMVSQDILNASGAITVYSNDNDAILILTQSTGSDGTLIMLDAEYDYETRIEINGRILYIYSYEDQTDVLAYMESGYYIFTLTAYDMDPGEIEEIYRNWIF